MVHVTQHVTEIQSSRKQKSQAKPEFMTFTQTEICIKTSDVCGTAKEVSCDINVFLIRLSVHLFEHVFLLILPGTHYVLVVVNGFHIFQESFILASWHLTKLFTHTEDVPKRVVTQWMKTWPPDAHRSNVFFSE